MTDRIVGVPTGFKDLDRYTSGLQSGDLVIIAARPCMGKTALASNIAINAALDHEVPVCIFSLELLKDVLERRLLSTISRIAYSRLLSAALEDSDWPKMLQGVKSLSASSIYIDETPNFSVEEMLTAARRMKSEFNIGLIVVDYLQLMHGSNSDSRNQEIYEISRSLKAMAKELYIPVIALSQLNRSLENRNDKRPILSDLHGAIEQNADVIFFIYRDEYYNKSPGNPRRGITEVIIGKQRNGPVGTIDLVFLHNTITFRDLTHSEN